MTISRRILLKSGGLAGAAVAFGAHAQVNVDEKDPQAIALGYVGDAGRADAKKFPKYAAGQACNNCALYQGKAGDVSGNCPLFAGKQVSAKVGAALGAKRPDPSSAKREVGLETGRLRPHSWSG